MYLVYLYLFNKSSYEKNTSINTALHNLYRTVIFPPWKSTDRTGMKMPKRTIQEIKSTEVKNDIGTEETIVSSALPKIPEKEKNEDGKRKA